MPIPILGHAVALHKSFTTISADPQHATPRFRMGIPFASILPEIDQARIKRYTQTFRPK